MNTLQRIRQAVRTQQYRISTHANEEMAEDNLELMDVENILETGHIAHKLTRDPRGTRFEIVGETTDGRTAAVACRFLASGVLLIITAYAKEGESYE